MSDRILHPSLDGVHAIHAEVLAAHGGSPGLRSAALLEAALAAPQAAMPGAVPTSDPVEVAAAYFFHLCRNDAFVKGSRGTALATCLVFLSENGLLPNEELKVEAWENFTLEVAAGVLTRDEVTQRLRSLLS